MPRSENDVVDIWPENVTASEVWFALDSNWHLNIGMSGSILEPPGHANVVATIEGLGVKKRHRRRLFKEFCVMEQAALEVLASSE